MRAILLQHGGIAAVGRNRDHHIVARDAEIVEHGVIGHLELGPAHDGAVAVDLVIGAIGRKVALAGIADVAEIARLGIDLGVRAKGLQRQFAIDDLKRKIRVTEAQIAYDGKVIAGRDGSVLDLQVIAGQTVKLRDRLGTIGRLQQTSKKAPDLKAVAYFAPADARRLPLGMPIEVVPHWKQRGRFGGIVGKVSSVLTLPSTEDDVSTITGNPQLAKELTKDGPVMRADIELTRNKASFDGYSWTISWGSGVFPIREGLTTTAHAYVEWRSPVSYVIPGLRSLTGGYRTLRIDRLWNRPFLVQPDTID